MSKESETTNNSKPMAYDTLLAAGYTPKRVLIIVESFIKEYRDECELYSCMDDKKLKVGEKLVTALKDACS